MLEIVNSLIIHRDAINVAVAYVNVKTLNCKICQFLEINSESWIRTENFLRSLSNISLVSYSNTENFLPIECDSERGSFRNQGININTLGPPRDDTVLFRNTSRREHCCGVANSKYFCTPIVQREIDFLSSSLKHCNSEIFLIPSHEENKETMIKQIEQIVEGHPARYQTIWQEPLIMTAIIELITVNYFVRLKLKGKKLNFDLISIPDTVYISRSTLSALSVFSESQLIQTNLNSTTPLTENDWEVMAEDGGASSFVYSSHSHLSEGTQDLYTHMNNCKTLLGSALLKINLTQPINNPIDLILRSRVVYFFVTRFAILNHLRGSLLTAIPTVGNTLLLLRKRAPTLSPIIKLYTTIHVAARILSEIKYHLNTDTVIGVKKLLDSDDLNINNEDVSKYSDSEDGISVSNQKNLIQSTMNMETLSEDILDSAPITNLDNKNISVTNYNDAYTDMFEEIEKQRLALYKNKFQKSIYLEKQNTEDISHYALYVQIIEPMQKTLASLKLYCTCIDQTVTRLKSDIHPQLLSDVYQPRLKLEVSNQYKQSWLEVITVRRYIDAILKREIVAKGKVEKATCDGDISITSPRQNYQDIIKHYQKIQEATGDTSETIKSNKDSKHDDSLVMQVIAVALDIIKSDESKEIAELHLIQSSSKLPSCMTIIYSERLNKHDHIISSRELKAVERYLKISLEKFKSIERGLVMNLVGVARTYLPRFADLLSIIGLLDMLSTFAFNTFIKGKTICPKYAVKDIYLEDNIHILLEATQLENIIQCNNVDTRSENGKLQIISGPNMGGKTTYLRQIGLTCLIAHCGAWVPAKYAEIPPLDAIICRVGAGDSLTSGVSTFMVEMIEAAEVLRWAKPNKLLLVDELGRGTSTSEGFGLAWAIAQSLADSQAFTFFATHFHELQALESQNLRVSCKYMDVHIEGSAVNLTYQLKDGKTNQSLGPYIAELAGYPKSVVDHSKELLAKFSRSE